jgi:hypothetical protein
VLFVGAGQRVEAGGRAINPTGDEWLQRWRGIRQRHPEYGSLDLAGRGSLKRGG